MPLKQNKDVQRVLAKIGDKSPPTLLVNDIEPTWIFMGGPMKIKDKNYSLSCILKAANISWNVLNKIGTIHLSEERDCECSEAEPEHGEVAVDGPVVNGIEGGVVDH